MKWQNELGMTEMNGQCCDDLTSVVEMPGLDPYSNKNIAYLMLNTKS